MLGRSKDTVFAGCFTSAFREQETGVVGNEVTFWSVEVERQALLFVFTQELTFLPSCPNNHLDQVIIFNFTLFVVLKTCDVGVDWRDIARQKDLDYIGDWALVFYLVNCLQSKRILYSGSED